MTKYMITFTHVEGGMEDRVPRFAELTAEEGEQLRNAHSEFADALQSEQSTSMQYLAGPAEAKTVCMHKDGRLELTDGPFRDGPEQPGGFFIIEAQSMDAAVEWAKRGRWLVGSNEVRELVEL